MTTRRSRIVVLYDEREHIFKGVCENCKKQKDNVRKYEAFGIFQEPRGFYDICFDCVGPTVRWTNLDTNMTYNSPAFNYAEVEKEGVEDSVEDDERDN